VLIQRTALLGLAALVLALHCRFMRHVGADARLGLVLRTTFELSALVDLCRTGRGCAAVTLLDSALGRLRFGGSRGMAGAVSMRVVCRASFAFHGVSYS
jgi:hypothetical protein